MAQPTTITLMPTTSMEVEVEEEEEAEEEKVGLLSGCKVVEYLGPMMSSELLVKFPDNSAFDFDYSQSSLWSPLVPRFHRPLDMDVALLTPKNLTLEGVGFDELDAKSNEKKKKTKSSTVATPGFNVNLSVLKMKQHKKKKKNVVSPSRFSTTTPVMNCACVPFVPKGWNKMLKAASKHFKKKKKMKDPMSHVKLSKYLRSN
ncbi:hypothetical protein Tsubulata_019538 [Turnera subulata]|uniref:Uncharacterized protein n=1 Tax=Turnera subulata TaxID=218843 RepID=A0A9Q0J5F3_9ROSI|nr:hypothetical protein Tsubulata_019538 [Turnera subulata]